MLLEDILRKEEKKLQKAEEQATLSGLAKALEKITPIRKQYDQLKQIAGI